MKRSLILLSLVALACPTYAQEQAPPNPDQLRADFRQAYESSDYKAAVKIGLQLVKVDPADARNLYNLACAYALTEKTISAGKYLKKAAKKGFSDYTLATTDPDLVSIRTDPGYMEAVKLIRKNQDEGRAEFDALAGKSKPLIYVPPGHVRTAASPLLVVLHGWGSNAREILEAWKPTANEFDAILLAPAAVRRAKGVLGYTWGPVDEADILVKRAIEKVKKAYQIDKQRIVLSGFSQGAFMTYHLGMRHATDYCGLIPVAGRYDQTVHAASHVAPNQLPKVFIMVGGDDGVLENNKRAARALEAAGFRVKLEVYPGVGHRYPENYQAEFRKALQFFWP